MGIISKIASIPIKAVKKVKEKAKEKNKEETEEIKRDFIVDMADVMVDWGIDQKEALKIAEDIFEKQKEKIMEVL